MPNDVDTLSDMLSGYGIVIAAVVAVMERSNLEARSQLIELLDEFVLASGNGEEEPPEMKATHDLLRFLRREGRPQGRLIQ